MEDQIKLILVENDYTSIYIPSNDYHKELIESDNEIFKYLSKYEYLLQNKNIVDVGSCNGMYSKYYKKITKQKVYCYEPNNLNYEILKINVDNLNVILSNKAVGSKKTKTFLIHKDKTNLGQSVFFNKYFFNDDLISQIMNKLTNDQDIDTLKNKNGIDVISLDSLNLKEVGLIKIDVEGFEIDVLKGCKQLISEFKPLILIGTHKINNINTKNDVFKILKNYNYELVKEFKKCDEFIFKYKENE